jgi:hypothetical protein
VIRQSRTIQVDASDDSEILWRALEENGSCGPMGSCVRIMQ